MSTIALFLALSAVIGAGVCLACCLRLAYDLRRAIRVIDRLQRRQRWLESRLMSDVETWAFGMRLIEGTVRDLHRRIYGATAPPCYTLPEEVSLGAN